MIDFQIGQQVTINGNPMAVQKVNRDIQDVAYGSVVLSGSIESSLSPRVQVGRPIVVGIRDPLPLRGFPAGHTRIKLSRGSGRVFVRPPGGGLREFAIEERNGAWWPAFEVSRRVSNLNAVGMSLPVALIPTTPAMLDQWQQQALQDNGLTFGHGIVFGFIMLAVWLVAGAIFRIR